MNIDQRLDAVKKEILSISAEIQEKSQNEDDYFMLDHIADSITNDLKLIGLFAE